MKTTEEKIKVMQHFLNGGEVMYTNSDGETITIDFPAPLWDWSRFDYNIVVPKAQTIIIEKWLCSTTDEFDNIEYWTCESSNIDSYIKHIDYEKVTLLDKYEVEL